MSWRNRRLPEISRGAGGARWRERTRERARLDEFGFEFVGGGSFPLLYFLIRLLEPEIVVETGRASGFSTHAILVALRYNRRGNCTAAVFPVFILRIPGNT